MKTTPKTNPARLKAEKFDLAFINYLDQVNQRYGLHKTVHNRLLKLTRESQ